MFQHPLSPHGYKRLENLPVPVYAGNPAYPRDQAVRLSSDSAPKPRQNNYSTYLTDAVLLSGEQARPGVPRILDGRYPCSKIDPHFL